MKLKCVPEDFQVEELTEFECSAKGGAFAVYKLTKRSLGTPEAIDAVVQRWKIQRHAVSYGGLKDRHAVTQQYVTIQKGPRRDLEQSSFSLVYQGQTARAFGPPDIAGNRFHIVIRDLPKHAADHLVGLKESLLVDRIPNYFDDQRFGSLGSSQEFIAQPWCAGDYERALWLAIAEPNVHDRPGDKDEKRILREDWGNWESCKSRLPKSTRRSIITYLCDHPTNFKQAFALIRVDLRGLYLSAYQSFLWNHLLAAKIRQVCKDENLFNVDLAALKVPFFGALTAEEQMRLTDVKLPLPSARLELEPGPTLDLYEEMLGKLGTALREIRVKYPRDSFFSKGDRPALIVPHSLSMSIADDDRYSRRHKVILDFELPRGSYATILLKRLTHDPIHQNREGMN
jgi:tRNA pseudouridine13 synthase